jgi:hypothetical protein
MNRNITTNDAPIKSIMTAEENLQIIKALTAGAGKPPSKRELAIAFKWAGLTAVASTFLTGVLRGDLTMNIRGDEPEFDFTKELRAAWPKDGLPLG